MAAMEKPASSMSSSSFDSSSVGSECPTLASAATTSSSCSASTCPSIFLGSWKSSGSKSHHKNSPLVATRSPQEESDRVQKLIERRKELPDTWYYSSNHVLVNQERTNRTIAPLIRQTHLDEIARIHAEQMASNKQVQHLSLEALHIALEGTSYHRLGINVQKGSSIRRIHEKMMQSQSNKNNITDRRYTHMGMATAVDADGVLYLCQVFRG